MRITALLFLLFSINTLQAQLDSLRQSKDSNQISFEEVNVALSLSSHCVNGKSTLTWEVQAQDSLHFPKKLKLFYRELNDTMVEEFLSLDSQTIYVKGHVTLEEPGLYLLDFLDSVRKVHYSSNELFLDVCTQFQLPDVFYYTPGKLYEPSQINHIAKIELVIFSSAGDQVFYTKNPKVQWDGRNQASGALCAPGTYFYNCDVYEDLQQGQVKRSITGIIQLTY